MKAETLDTARYMFSLFDGRGLLVTVENRAQRELEEEERALKEKVASATVDHIKHQFQKDMETLKSRVKGRDQIAMEAAKDAKYLVNRQTTFVCVWLFVALNFDYYCTQPQRHNKASLIFLIEFCELAQDWTEIHQGVYGEILFRLFNGGVSEWLLCILCRDCEVLGLNCL